MAAGELHPSVLAALSRYLTPENARELFAACKTTPIQRKLEPLSEARFGVHFTANGEFKRLLEEVLASGVAKRSRHVPADAAREVYLRDGGSGMRNATPKAGTGAA